MSCQQETLAALRAAGYRLTPQRTMVIEALHHPGGHLTADEVLARVQAQHPYVDVSTVYRTLDLLTGLGIVHVFNTPDGPGQFELAGERHHHLVCAECGAVEVLDAALLDELTERLQARHAFAASLEHLAIPGRCAGCQSPGSGQAPVDA